jgi:hypothetical protein
MEYVFGNLPMDGEFITILFWWNKGNSGNPTQPTASNTVIQNNYN